MSHIIKFKTYNCTLKYSTYITNKRIAIGLIDVENYQPIAVATVNIPNIYLEYNEVAIKNWSENEGILETLINERIINKPHRYINIGFVKADICYLTDHLIILQNLLKEKKYNELSKI